MANNIEDHDDESKIITQFFLNTCQQRQPSQHRVKAANLCAAHATEQWWVDDEVAYIPLITGSVAEFYIQPMLNDFGDFDIMFHHSNMLAIPYGYLPPPSQLPAEFNSRVKVFAITDPGEFPGPGYVCLMSCFILTENADTNRYVAKLDENFSDLLMHYTSFDRPKESIEVHGPARSLFMDEFDTTLDRVYCIRCLWWPTQAANWPTRHRNYDWPDSATVDRVVSNGCDMVQVAYRLWRQDERITKIQYRLSFSRAEIVLLNSWMPVQQIIYHMLRVFMKTEGLTSFTDHTGSKPISNYHIKTLMMWACELKPRSWWVDDLNVIRICVPLLRTMSKWLENKTCRHYFVKKCNIHDTTSDAEIIVGQLIPITESWLSKWFVDNYLPRCAQFCPDSVSRLFDDVSTRMKLQNAVSAVVEWRSLTGSWFDLYSFEGDIARTVNSMPLNVWCCHCWITEFAKIHPSLVTYFTAVACLEVAYITSNNSLSETLLDVLVTILGHVVCKRRHSGQSNGLLLLRQSKQLMKFVANS